MKKLTKKKYKKKCENNLIIMVQAKDIWKENEKFNYGANGKV